MQSGHHEVEQLFSFVDQAIELSPGLAQSALELILSVEPGHRRAERLLSILQSDYVPPDPLRLVIEAAEALADQGLHVQAREVVAYVERRYGSHDEARAWLDGVDLLLES